MNIDILNITTFAETPQLRTVVDLFDIANAVATILIGLVGFIISRSVKHRNDRELRAERRALIKDACAGVDMEFAIGLFQDQTYSHDARTRVEFGQLSPPERGKAPKIPEKTTVPDRGPLKRYDWEAIFGRSQPFEAWHRHARSAALVFFETLRPCAHLIGGEHGTLGLESPSIRRVPAAAHAAGARLTGTRSRRAPSSARRRSRRARQLHRRDQGLCEGRLRRRRRGGVGLPSDVRGLRPGSLCGRPEGAGKSTATEML